MHQALKEAITICKTLLRNGYDAHVINAPLQEELLRSPRQPAVDIACEPDMDTLAKLFPKVRMESEKRDIAEMEENGILFRFYPLEVKDAGHPELSLLRITPSMAAMMKILAGVILFFMIIWFLESPDWSPDFLVNMFPHRVRLPRQAHRLLHS